MAPRAELWPYARAIQARLNGLAKTALCDDVLEEAQLAAGHQDSVQLCERYLLIYD